MKIIRDGQEFQLTYNELCEAHKEFVINWMADAVSEELENSNLSNEMVRELAEDAYFLYSKGDGLTEYEAVQFTVEEYKNKY